MKINVGDYHRAVKARAILGHAYANAGTLTTQLNSAIEWLNQIEDTGAERMQIGGLQVRIALIREHLAELILSVNGDIARWRDDERK